ncbi:hypothetical protein JOF29_007131 [Kribbella aluminosa]|uniref:Sialidase domain-containing protein n=1 Tax=Kribbella aluminosa TaxID=416017 RepID=A0ABS4UWV1_9ACTN|nr:sialidase family protein [Kribbella aluminosa]MBP2356021.1 hypothetical protein [Kribbella aluminosa]
MVLRRSTDNGKTWQDQQIVRQDPAPHGYGDPSFVVDRQTGRIYARRSPFIRRFQPHVSLADRSC